MGHANFGTPKISRRATRAGLFWNFTTKTPKIPLGALRAPIITRKTPHQKILGRSWDLGQAKSGGYKGGGGGWDMGSANSGKSIEGGLGRKDQLLILMASLSNKRFPWRSIR